MKNKIIIYILTTALGAAIWLSGCSEKIVNDKSGNIDVAVKIDYPVSAGQQAIEIFTLTVEAKDIAVPITTTMTLQGEYLTGTIEVPAGPKRKFTVEALDENLMVIYSGVRIMDVYPTLSEITAISINLVPAVPMIKITPHYRQLPMGPVFSFDVEVYYIPNLHSLYFNLTHYGTVTIMDSVVRGSTLDPLAYFSAGIEPLSTTPGQQAFVNISSAGYDIPEPLVNRSGYANLGTFYFHSYCDYEPSSESVDLTLQLTSLDVIDGDSTRSLPVEDIFVDKSEVDLLRKTWELTYGNGGNERSYNMVQTPDGGFALVGLNSAGTYLLKIDSLGDTVWSNTFGSNGDRGYGIINSSDGGLAITGRANRSAAYSSLDMFLMKTDAFGNEIWTSYFGDSSSESGSDIQQTTDGGYIIVGEKDDYIYLVKTNSMGVLDWEEVYEDTFSLYGGQIAHTVIQTSDGGYFVAGQIYYPNESSDAYLMKVNSSGVFLWDEVFNGDYYNEEFRSIIRTIDGNYVLVGTLSQDVYMVKINSSGNIIWDQEFGGVDDDAGYSVAQTRDDGYILTGTFYNYANSTYDDLYLIRTNSNGDTIWTKTFGDYYSEYGYSVVATTDGGFIAGGYISSEIYYVYVVKTDANGETYTIKEMK